MAASNWVMCSGSSSPRRSARPASTSSTAPATFSIAAPKAAGSISRPSIRVRSLQRHTCGEMQAPLRSPASASSAAVIIVTDDLPFVPTTCSVRYRSWGRPS